MKMKLVLIGCAFWHAIGHSQQLSQQKTRQIVAQRNVPIATQLLPDDEIVLVEPVGFETRFVDTTVKSVSEDLDMRAKASDLIAVAESVVSESFLINDDSWVRSRVTFRPLCIIKDRTGVTHSATSLPVFHDGGDVRIKGVFVRAGYFYKYVPGGKYLIFLRSFRPDNNATVGLQMGIGPDNKLTPMELSTGRTFPAASPLHGLDLEFVISELARRLTPNNVSFPDR